MAEQEEFQGYPVEIEQQNYEFRRTWKHQHCIVSGNSYFAHVYAKDFDECILELQYNAESKECEVY